MSCEPVTKAEVEWIIYDQGKGWEAGHGNGKEKTFQREERLHERI